MGFLSGLWNSIVGPSDTEEAVIDAVCASVLADGTLEEAEIAYAVEFVASMLSLNIEEAATLVDASLVRLGPNRRDLLLQSIAARVKDSEDREALILAACTAIMADRVFSSEEVSWMRSLGSALELELDRVQGMIERASMMMQASAVEDAQDEAH